MRQAEVRSELAGSYKEGLDALQQRSLLNLSGLFRATLRESVSGNHKDMDSGKGVPVRRLYLALTPDIMHSELNPDMPYKRVTKDIRDYLEYHYSIFWSARMRKISVGRRISGILDDFITFSTADISKMASMRFLLHADAQLDGTFVRTAAFMNIERDQRDHPTLPVEMFAAVYLWLRKELEKEAKWLNHWQWPDWEPAKEAEYVQGLREDTEKATAYWAQRTGLQGNE